MTAKTRTKRRSATAKAFAARLRKVREQQRLTQAELAERAGLDVSFVSQLERGLRDPSLSSLLALSAATGLQLAEFLTGLEQTREQSATAQAIAHELTAFTNEQLDEVLLIVRAMRRMTATPKQS